MRAEVSGDMQVALELADTVEFLEQFRGLRTEATPNMAGKMQDVALQSERYCRQHFAPSSRRWYLPLMSVAAAAGTFWALTYLDAGSSWLEPARPPVQLAQSYAPNGAGQVPLATDVQGLVNLEPVMDADEAAWRSTILQIRRRLEAEGGEHLKVALEAGLANEADDLGKWLDPANAVTMMRLGYELRANADLRATALRDLGALPEVDDRVQEAAALISDDLATVALTEGVVGSAELVADVAWGVRALVGAGSTTHRSAVTRRCGDWLASVLPDSHGGDLVVALSALVELAAAYGDHVDAVAAHGRRLVDEVLTADGENWHRRRPALLAGNVSSQVLGDAGRLVARLPAFNADADRCTLVRQLVLGRLREQRALGQDQPEVLAAMVYGCSDLLDKGEGDRLSWALQRWKPARLAPDYATVQQMAWSLSPGSRGHTRMQRELRQLAVMPTPRLLRERAAFCLCLATNYAGFVHGISLPARQPRGS